MTYSMDQQARREPEHIATRASLLAGLRTGNRQQRQSSPGFQYDARQYQHQQHVLDHAAATRQLTANAPIFVPGSQSDEVSTPPEMFGGDYMSHLENQLAALQMSAMHSTANVAASYGATQGQPQHHHYQQRAGQSQHSEDQINQEAVAHFLRQRQAQQEYEQQRQQLEAMAVQQKRTAQAAAQQRALFAHVQAEYERQAQVATTMQQQQSYHLNTSSPQSAHQQRQAAQASIQANLRNRQAQQLYNELLEEEKQGRLDRRALGGRDLWQVALDAVNDQHEEAASFAETQEQLRQQQFEQYSLQIQQLQEQTRQAVEAQRLSQEAHQGQQQPQRQPRERVASHADQINNWRSRSSTPAAAVNVVSANAEDRDSTDSTSPRSSRSFNTADTPRTPEENGDMATMAVAAATGDLSKVLGLKQQHNQNQQSTGRFGSSLGRGPAPSASLSMLPNGSLQLPSKSQPRAFSLAAAPRTRVESSGVGGTAMGSMKPASRQPRGPPTEFEAVNFASRRNARTRKEALSKLRACSSPRIVSTPVVIV
ncbi:unnamed protein product [Sympodiomycopsis kandeliae]